MYSVLLVDDERMSLVSARCALNCEATGFHYIEEIENPYKALELLKRRRYDVAFIDIRMPEMSGLQLIEYAKDVADVIFVILTGYSDFDYAKKAIKLDVFDYCLKPIQTEDVDNLLPRLSDELWRKRLGNDPGIYKRMCKEDDLTSILRWLGLSYERKLMAVVAVRSTDRRYLINDILVDSEQSTLIIDTQCALRLITCDDDPTEAICSQYTAVGCNAGVVYSIINNQKCGLLGHVIRHAVTLADIQFQDKINNGNAGVREFSAYDATRRNDNFDKLLNEVDENFPQELSLAELAEKYEINYSYCSVLFNSRLGVNFSKYINALRLNQSKILLSDTDYSIGDISYMVGYNNYNHFVLNFKSAYGITPSQYKKQIRQLDENNKK